MTREKLTLRPASRNCPIELTVENLETGEGAFPMGSAKIDQLIYVIRDGHKGSSGNGDDDQSCRPGRPH